MIVKIPPNVNTAVTSLQNAGFAAFAVGGAVRDSLMGRECSDWDVTTSALPEQTEKVFEGLRIIETGIKHGTVTVIIGGEPIEITTFRVDGDYTDNRHPDSVAFTSDIANDLSRRDFTVNALAYNDKDGLVDLFGGARDISEKIIRCVGNPDTRFNEDALRIMRALRFSSVLGFDIEPETANSIVKNRELLNNVSAERIASELCKLLCGEGAAKVTAAFPQVFAVILPELENAFGERLPDTCRLLSLTSPLPGERLASLAVFCGNPEEKIRAALRRLKCSNRLIDSAALLCEYSKKEFALLPEPAFKKELGVLGRERALSVLSFQEALFSPDNAKAAAKKAKEIFDSGECITAAGLKIKGNDLSGIASGKEIGATLNALLDEVLSKKTKNEKAELLAAAARLNRLGDIQND